MWWWVISPFLWNILPILAITTATIGNILVSFSPETLGRKTQKSRVKIGEVKRRWNNPIFDYYNNCTIISLQRKLRQFSTDFLYSKCLLFHMDRMASAGHVCPLQYCSKSPSQRVRSFVTWKTHHEATERHLPYGITQHQATCHATQVNAPRLDPS